MEEIKAKSADLGKLQQCCHDFIEIVSGIIPLFIAHHGKSI